MSSNDRLIRKLQADTVLGDYEIETLARLPIRPADLAGRQDIVKEGDRPSKCCLVVEGVAIRYKLTAHGDRQILAVHLPGDVPDLQSLLLRTLDHTLATLSPCRVGFIDHADLLDAITRAPMLGRALWRETLIDAAIFREWMTGLGRRDAPERLAHFFCEIGTRLQAVGLAADNGYPLHITQQELADAMGLTTVHINRTLRELREAGLVTLSDGRVSIPDWSGLRARASFDPTYLHLRSR